MLKDIHRLHSIRLAQVPFRRAMYHKLIVYPNVLRIGDRALTLELIP